MRKEKLAIRRLFRFSSGVEARKNPKNKKAPYVSTRPLLNQKSTYMEKRGEVPHRITNVQLFGHNRYYSELAI